MLNNLKLICLSIIVCCLLLLSSKQNALAVDFALLISTATTTGQDHIYIPTGTYIADANLTIPENISVEFAPGAMLKPSAGVTITINGEIMAGELQQIFEGNGSIILGKAQNVYSPWFGAKLDGVTDDTEALKKADHSAAYGSTIITPYTTFGIYIADCIWMTSGKTWDFCNNKMNIPLFTTAQNIFYTGSKGQNPLTDITVKRLKAFTPIGSNVYLFESNNGVTNLKIEDLYAENMGGFGIKLDRQCTNVEMNNIEISNSKSPIYMSGVKGLIGNNWRLSLPSTAQNGDHQIYFNAGMQDVKITNIELTGNGGLEGACIIVQNSRSEALVSRDIYFDGIRMFNVHKGLAVSVGDCINVNFNNVYGNGLGKDEYWLSLGWGTCTGKVIEGVNLTNFSFENTGGGLVVAQINFGVRPRNIKISNGIVTGRAGFNMIVPEGIDGLYLKNIFFTEGQGTNPDAKFITSGSAAGFDCSVDNCKVYYTNNAPSSPPIAVSGTGNNSLVINNSSFINDNSNYTTGICWCTGSNSKVIFENNQYKGFSKVKTDSDTITEEK